MMMENVCGGAAPGAIIEQSALTRCDDRRLHEMHSVAVIAHSTAVHIWELSLRLGAENELVLCANSTAAVWRRHLTAIGGEMRRRGIE